MKVLVPIKRSIDFQVKIRIKPDFSGVETHNVKMSMNPFDAIALEEAIRWKEQKKIAEVIVVSVGEVSIQESLRQALAMGADRAIHVQEKESDLFPLDLAKILKAIVEKENSQIVIMGKQSIDYDNNQVGQMLAGLLDWPQGTFASKIEFQNSEHIKVTREVDGGLEILRLKLPAIITADLRLNEPRFASLPNIMKAKSKIIELLTLETLGIRTENFCETLHVKPPVKRQGGTKLNSISELMKVLKDKEEVLP